MDFTTVLIVFSIFYGALLFFDTFFKTCAHYPYLQFLKNTGLEIGFFRLKWKTSFFNRILLRIGSGHTRMLNLWFDAGLYISLALLPVSLVLLFAANFQLLISSKNDSQEDRKPILEPMIPGVNLPASEIGYYVTVLLICSVFHELGHALAAVKEDVHLIDFGLSVIFILPVAFVNISTEKLSSIGPWRALRIMCAGVWHNIVLVLIAGFFYLTLPFFVSPLYNTGIGIVVTDVSINSPLGGVRGLKLEDVITKINDCSVRDEVTWQQCLSYVRTIKMGYCVNADVVHELDESGPLIQLPSGMWDCCGSQNPKNMCFEYLESSEGIMELPQHMCLPARRIVEESEFSCYGNTRFCPNPLHCIKPMLSNTTSLMLIQRTNKENIVYVGHPADIFLTITVSPFVPKYKFPSFLFAALVNRLLKYIVVFSGGLAILNIMPCLFLDGQHIVNLVAVIILRDRFNRHSITTVSMVITILGTLMLFINIIYTFWAYIFRT